MIPPPWAFAILAFGAYRLCRLVGWDDWPPIAKLRARVLGEDWVQSADPAVGVSPVYRRPTLAHFVHCPFCVGWWISVAVYTGWLLEPRWTLLVLAPFALSGVVGLVAKNLDP